MQGILHHAAGARRLALLVIAGGLTAACSTYYPLHRGSSVPWAKATQLESAGAATEDQQRDLKARPQVARLPSGSYQVRSGDRLSGLARMFGVSVRALAEANDLEAPYVIYVGQILQIPNGGLTDEPKPTVVTSGNRYVVRRGDTLSDIAERIDVPMTQLAAANKIASPYRLHAGQKLRFPGSDAADLEPSGSAPAAPRIAKGTPPPLSGRGFLWPVNGKVVGGFGPIGQGQRRDGIDIAARQGAPVLAAEDGLVAYAGDGIRGYGRLILLRHAEGYITTYAHNAALLVDVGDLVERGQVIARVGATGEATRSQLHFELRQGRTPIDPETVLVREPTAVASTQ